MIKIKTNLTFSQVFNRALKCHNIDTAYYIRRGNWPEKYFWEVRNYTDKPEDIQFKPCTVESDDINYLPTGVRNDVLCVDAIANDWEFYGHNETNRQKTNM